MKNLKISTKALIIRNDKILMVRKVSKRRQSFYTLPGGTLEVEETIHRSLMREVFEETGAAIKVLHLVWSVERKLGSSNKEETSSLRMEYIFKCSIDDEYKARIGHSPDSNQTGVKWLKISKLDKYSIAPKRLRESLDEILANAC